MAEVVGSMPKSLDELIRFLIDEIALCGERGMRALSLSLSLPSPFNYPLLQVSVMIVGRALFQDDQPLSALHIIDLVHVTSTGRVFHCIETNWALSLEAGSRHADI